MRGSGAGARALLLQRVRHHRAFEALIFFGLGVARVGIREHDRCGGEHKRDDPERVAQRDRHLRGERRAGGEAQNRFQLPVREVWHREAEPDRTHPGQNEGDDGAASRALTACSGDRDPARKPQLQPGKDEPNGGDIPPGQ